MTLNNFLNTYGGNDCITIHEYCEETRKSQIMFSDWYKEIKNRTIKSWNTIGGGSFKVEVCITLK